jgi:hypothetical protein
MEGPTSPPLGPVAARQLPAPQHDLGVQPLLARRHFALLESQHAVLEAGAYTRPLLSST